MKDRHGRLLALAVLLVLATVTTLVARSITRLTPMQGFCAETGGAFAILVATKFGIVIQGQTRSMPVNEYAALGVSFASPGNFYGAPQPTTHFLFYRLNRQQSPRQCAIFVAIRMQGADRSRI